MEFKKALSEPKTLIILLLLALFTFFTAYNYQQYAQEMEVMREEIKEMESNQDLTIRLLEKKHCGENEDPSNTEDN